MTVATDTLQDMRAVYARRAAVYERVYAKPERQADLRAMKAALPVAFAGRRVLEVACGTGWWTLHARLEPGSRVRMVDKRCVESSSTPLSRTDEDGSTCQDRPLNDGSVHEVLKNFPTREQAFARLGPRAQAPEWIEFDHYWMLNYRLN